MQPECFDITTPTLTLRNLKAAVQACANAYTEAPDISDDATGTNLTIKDCGDRIEIAFRGTVARPGWLIDARAWFCPFLIGQTVFRVHAGFCDSFGAVLPKLKAELSAMPRKPIACFGHSKGSAEALLAAVKLKNAGFDVRACFGAGTPRVGDRAFARYCNELLPGLYWRVVDEADIVARIPSAMCGFRFAGQELFLSGDGYSLNPVMPLKFLSDEIELWQARRKGAAAFESFTADHAMARYVERISALL